MKLTFFSLLLMIISSHAMADKVVAECQDPWVQMIQQGSSGNFYKLKLSAEARRAFNRHKVPYSDNSDIFNFRFTSECTLETNMIRQRTAYTLEVCGSEWSLKAHIWDRLRFGNRDFQITLRNCK